jgi:hypothetical protein
VPEAAPAKAAGSVQERARAAGWEPGPAAVPALEQEPVAAGQAPVLEPVQVLALALALAVPAQARALELVRAPARAPAAAQEPG